MPDLSIVQSAPLPLHIVSSVPAASATPYQDYVRQGTGSIVGDALSGAGAGAFHTLIGAYKLLRMVPGVGDKLPKPNDFVEALGTAPDTIAGHVANMDEQLAEFMIPATKVAKAVDGANLITHMATQAATAGAVTGVQTGGDTRQMEKAELLGAGATAAAAGAGKLVGAVLDNPKAAAIAARMGKNALGLFSPRARFAAGLASDAVDLGKALTATDEFGDTVSQPPITSAATARAAAPTAAPAEVAPAEAPAPPIVSTEPLTPRSDAIRSAHGLLPPIERSQYFRPLPGDAAPAPTQAAQLLEKAKAEGNRGAVEFYAKKVEAEAAAAQPAPTQAAPPEAAQPEAPPEPVRTSQTPALSDAQKFEDQQTEHAAYLQMQADEITWANRARKADRFAAYLTKNKMEPTPENLAKATKALAERDVPSAETVDMIHDRMGYQEPQATPEAAPAAPAPGPEPAAGEAPRPGTLAQLSPHSISADPVRFQFKQAVGQKGVSDKLKDITSYDSDLGGKLAVWYDPADGKTYVVNGHHRLELAQRTNAPSVDVRYIDAANATEARAKGALINIAEDQGTALDAAKLFRDTGITPADLKARNIALNGRIARAGMGLANLDQSIFDQVVSGDIPTETASTIGEMLPGRFADQRAVMDAVDKAAARGKAMTPAQISESIRVGMRPGNDITETQDTLFGSMAQTRSLFAETGELSDYIRKQLSSEKRLFGAVASDAAAERLGGAGNVINAGANSRIAEETKHAQAVYDKLSGMSGPVSDALASGARELAKNAGNSNAIKQSTYDAVRKAISETLAGREGAVSPRLPAVRSDGGGQAAEQGSPDLFAPEEVTPPSNAAKLEKLKKKRPSK